MAVDVRTTDEGVLKDEQWCKSCIWGNLLPQWKDAFGNVDKISSKSFVGLWTERINHLANRYSVTEGLASGQPQKSRSPSIAGAIPSCARPRLMRDDSRRSRQGVHPPVTDADRRRQAARSDPRRSEWSRVTRSCKNKIVSCAGVSEVVLRHAFNLEGFVQFRPKDTWSTAKPRRMETNASQRRPLHPERTGHLSENLVVLLPIDRQPLWRRRSPARAGRHGFAPRATSSCPPRH